MTKVDIEKEVEVLEVEVLRDRVGVLEVQLQEERAELARMSGIAAAQGERAQALANAAVRLLQLQGDLYRLRDLGLDARGVAEELEGARSTLLAAIRGE